MKSKSLITTFSPTISSNDQKLSTVLSIYIPFLIFNICINLAMISWINKLDEIQCECSQDWKKPLLQYWAYFAIVFSVLMFIINIFFLFKFKFIIQNGVGVISILSFMNIIGTLLYINNLKKINCKCSEDTRREIIYIIRWIQMIFFIFVLLLILIFIFVMFFIYSPKVLGIFIFIFIFIVSPLIYITIQYNKKDEEDEQEQ